MKPLRRNQKQRPERGMVKAGQGDADHDHPKGDLVQMLRQPFQIVADFHHNLSQVHLFKRGRLALCERVVQNAPDEQPHVVRGVKHGHEVFRAASSPLFLALFHLLYEPTHRVGGRLEVVRHNIREFFEGLIAPVKLGGAFLNT